MRARISGLGITKKFRRVSSVGSHHLFNEKAAIVAAFKFCDPVCVCTHDWL